MLSQIIACTVHLIHAHGVRANVAIFAFLLGTEGWPLAFRRLACFDLAPLHDVDLASTVGW